MIAFDLNRAKSLFLDSQKVMSAVSAGKRRAMMRFGGAVRQHARRSMRKRAGASPPGQPPHVHRGSIRKHLYFAYDPSADSVVIGPVRLGASPIVLELMEWGGERRRRNVRRKGQFVAARYPPRPFMQPAFQAQLGRLREFFENMLSGGR